MRSPGVREVLWASHCRYSSSRVETFGVTLAETMRTLHADRARRERSGLLSRSAERTFSAPVVVEQLGGIYESAADGKVEWPTRRT